MSLRDLPESIPRVAVQTHLDGDPKPRQVKIVEWDLMRRRYGLAQLVALILLPDDSVTDGPFPGFEMHSWMIRQRRGKVVCERQHVQIEVVPDVA